MGWLLVLYFTHLFALAAFLLLAGLYLAAYRLATPGWRLGPDGLRPVLHLAAAALPALALLAVYLKNQPGGGAWTYTPASELVGWLANLRSLMVYDHRMEKRPLYYLALALVVMGVAGAWRLFRNWLGANPIQPPASPGSLHTPAATGRWFGVLGVAAFLLLLFTAPTHLSTSGMLSVRFHLLFLFCLVVVLGMLPIPRVLLVLGLAVAMGVQVFRVGYFSKQLRTLNYRAVQVERLAPFVEPNSLVLPLNFSSHWLTIHFNNYLGVDKPLVLLENYECGTGYFPLTCAPAKLPTYRLGELAQHQLPCVGWRSGQNNQAILIDYVLLQQPQEAPSNSCHARIQQQLERHYQLAAESDGFQLHALKRLQ